MTNLRASSAQPFFDTALPVSFVLLLRFHGQCVPMVWVGTPNYANVTQVHSRLAAIGEQAGNLSEEERMEAYGEASTLWIYARELYPDTFFLHVTLAAPAFTHPRLTLPPFQDEYLLRCDREQESTDLLLTAIDESLGCFLQFDVVPLWIRELTAPIVLGAQGEQLDGKLAQLIRCSLPVYFNADSFPLIKQQFDAWRQKREHTEKNR